MLKKIPFLFILIVSVFAASVFAQQKTEISDARAKAMLLGKHKVSLQWISWDYFGIATVTDRKGTLSLKGSQRGRGNDDYLTIEGFITSINAKEFSFNGKIITKISHINQGKPCTREGEMTFKITGKRRYWRLQEMENPCDPVTDYVDIFFR